jgi:hypothetical protein
MLTMAYVLLTTVKTSLVGRNHPPQHYSTTIHQPLRKDKDKDNDSMDL